MNRSLSLKTATVQNDVMEILRIVDEDYKLQSKDRKNMSSPNMILRKVGLITLIFSWIWGFISGIVMFIPNLILAIFVDIPNEKKRKKRKAIVQRVEKSKPDAEQVLMRTDLRKYLCPALQSASDDAFQIAKLITPIIVPLTLAGTISIPLEPVFIATLSLVIARMGIASLCVDFKKEKLTDKQLA